MKDGGKSARLRAFVPVRILALLLALPLMLCGCGSSVRTQDTVLFIVRHGQTVGNVQELMQGGGSDTPLTSEGESTAHELGKALSSVHFDAAYSSTLGRAETTEQILLDENQADSVEEGTPDAAFDDINFGSADGMLLSEAEEQYGTFEEDTWFGDPDDASFVTPAGGENKYQFLERFGDGIDRILKEREESGGTILLTAHSSAAFYLRQKFPDAGIDSLANASVTIIRIRDGKWELLDVSDTDYGTLPDRLQQWGLLS